MAMLAFISGGKIGPKAVPGLIATTSKPFSFEKSQVAFSANVFATVYQICNQSNIIKRMDYHGFGLEYINNFCN